ncbi:hypothetical protein AVEN_118908-1 [Araneus ventricosus]|uniref:Uncharacterized protein n=1 Tax=Araneus ventricosus TaxID=182803 RepID=A0A4Y2TQM4_ARAVE|nr:hypothetical protein AVEN_118908-1 [Araneus ventricosus]
MTCDTDRTDKENPYDMRRPPYGHEKAEHMTCDTNRTERKIRTYDMRRQPYGHEKAEPMTCGRNNGQIGTYDVLRRRAVWS